MNKQAFQRGFIKQAVASGFNEQEANNFYKQAGSIPVPQNPHWNPDTGFSFPKPGFTGQSYINPAERNGPALHNFKDWQSQLRDPIGGTGNPVVATSRYMGGQPEYSVRQNMPAQLQQFSTQAGGQVIGPAESGNSLSPRVNANLNAALDRKFPATARSMAPTGTPVGPYSMVSDQTGAWGGPARPPQAYQQGIDAANRYLSTARPAAVNLAKSIGKGTLVGAPVAAGLDYLSPTQENNGNYLHDVVNQFNDTTKSIVGGGTAGALAGGVGAVPGAIGGGIYDIANKAMQGSGHLWDLAKMQMGNGEQQTQIAAMQEKLRQSEIAKSMHPWSSGRALPQIGQELGRLSGRLTPESTGN